MRARVQEDRLALLSLTRLLFGWFAFPSSFKCGRDSRENSQFSGHGRAEEEKGTITESSGQIDSGTWLLLLVASSTLPGPDGSCSLC